MAMLTLNEIENAVDHLTPEQKRELHRYLEESLRNGAQRPAHRGHGVLDIAPIRLGSVLQPPGADDDLLGEMLEGRQCGGRHAT
jgi:hypothetical protein